MLFTGVIQKLSKFWCNCQGNFALFFALLSPIVFGLVGGAVDLVIYQRQQAQMQDAVDMAALAAAREAGLQGWNEQIATEVAKSLVIGNLQGSKVSGSATISTLVDVDEENRKVHVTVDMDEYDFMVLGYFRRNPQIRVTATATSTNEANVCIIGLDPAVAATVSISGTAKLNAKSCAVYSNSTSPEGIAADNDSYIESQMSCTAGGYKGAPKNFSVTPTTDCPALEDPLAAREAPSAGNCDFTDLVIKNQPKTLNPGTYCGGIFIDTMSYVKFNPGIYVIKDGEFRSRDLAIATGVGVSFYFTGAKSRFTFDGTTVVDFTAPSTGPMAGLLFYQDPAAPSGLVFEIYSKIASNLLGTIYLPKATLSIKAKNKIAEKSAYTVIVAKKLEIGDATQMFINSNYSATTVPVPAGLGPQSGMVRLVK